MRTCTSAAPRVEEHRDELLHRVAAHDRVVDDHDALARDLVERVELEPDPLPPQLLVGLDERAADVAVLDQPFLVGDPGRLREADRGRCARVRDRHHEIGDRRVPPRRAARPCARGSRGSRCRRGASRAGRSRRARRCSAHPDPRGTACALWMPFVVEPERPRRGARPGRPSRRSGRARSSRTRPPSRLRSGRA